MVPEKSRTSSSSSRVKAVRFRKMHWILRNELTSGKLIDGAGMSIQNIRTIVLVVLIVEENLSGRYVKR